MRRFHEGFDRLYAAVVHHILPPLFREGHASPPLSDHLAAVELRVPPIGADGRYKLTARTLVGEVTAGFRLRLGPRADCPALIYHHGLGEFPYHRNLGWILPRRIPVDAHLVAVRAPFHRHHLDCLRGLASLSSFVAMCAVSVTLIEALRQALQARGAQGCVVTGTSLGGFVSLLHHLEHGTADRYAPLLAGPDLARSLLSTPFHAFLASAARAEPAVVQACLDFRAAFRVSDARRLLPLLARHDQCMPYAHHQPEYAARGVEVATIERGHMTGSLAFAALRAHLLGCLGGLAADAPAGRSLRQPA
jgi:hypothetical protein